MLFMRNRLREQFVNKSVVILGFGREGVSTYRLLRSIFPDKVIAVADASEEISMNKEIVDDENIELLTGASYQDNLDCFDVIIKSPGVKLVHPGLLKSKISSQTDIFLDNYGHQTIGITGTKGKSTTSSLINFILQKCGFDSVLLGNIGIPAFDMLDKINENTKVIYELSAHQLEYARHSPHISLLLNIFPEHLDYFTGFDEYQSAKLNICKNQKNHDILLIHSELKSVFDERNIACNCIKWIPDESVQIDNIKLMGSHNLINAMFAYFASVQVGAAAEKVLDAITYFTGLPHRLEYVCENKGVIFYNDSISTIPESAMAAVKALKNVDTIILGGFDRGLDYSELAVFLSESRVRNFIFMGKAGERMMTLFTDRNDGEFCFVDSLQAAVDRAICCTAQNSICLLSPAAASYDRFKNFEHRGDMYKEMVAR